MRMARVQFIVILLYYSLSAPVWGQDIPSRPESLEFAPLTFEVPDAGAFRAQLKNGIPVYIAEDRLLPLVTVRAFFRGGQYMEPRGKEGLADLTGTVWRTGGTESMDPSALDEEIDFLAASLSTSVGPVSGSVSLNLLSKDLDRGLELMMDVLLRPRFDQGRLTKARDDFLAGMKRRNDDTSSIEGREWSRLIYGDDFWINRLATERSIDSITQDDLIAFHRLLVNPEGMILAVAGDFERQGMIAKLNAAFGALEIQNQSIPEVPQPSHQPQPGVYLIDKPDVNQGRVSIGHIGLKHPVEDELDLELANDVLGGGGFTSWILSRVRSDEGLAYSAGSSFSIGNTIPGIFRAAFQSKSASCARAAQLTIDLIEKMRTEGPTTEDLTTSRASYLQTFPNRFQSPLQTVSLFASDHLFQRPADYWSTYRDRVKTVTLESARKAAAERIHPDQFVILVVGNIEEILKGDPDYPEVSFEKIGPVHRVPLRDPMTLEPLVE